MTGVNKLNKQLRSLKLKKVSKSTAKSTSSVVSNDSEDDVDQLSKEIQFKTELLWCRKDIEFQIEKCKNDRQLRLLNQGHVVLCDPKATLVRKRCVMNKLCGEYRKTMSIEIANDNNRVCQLKLFNIVTLMKNYDLFKELDLKWHFVKKSCADKHHDTSVDEFKFDF